MTYSTIRASEDGGYVYHDGFAIKGISFVPDDEFARYDMIRIPVEAAVQFVRCTLDHTHWFVWRNATGSALYRQTSDQLVLDLMGEQYERLPRSPGGWLLIKLYQDAEDVHRAVFQINTAIDFHCAVESLPFVFTVRDDSSAILYTVEVPVEPLLADGLYSLPLPFEPQPTDVHTRRVFPTHSVIDCAPEDNLVVTTLPGHFVDLMRCADIPAERGLQAAIDRIGGVLHLALVGSGVEVYDRSSEQLRLLFSMPGDPSLMLYATSVPTDSLRDGVRVELPKILRQPFDLWLPLLYRHAWLVELPPHDLIRCDTTPMDSGLQAAVDRAEGVLRLSLIGSGVEVYDRSSERLRLLFSVPGDPSLMLHATSVSIDALRDGIAVALPTILQQPFDLWLPSLSYRQAWVIEA